MTIRRSLLIGACALVVAFSVWLVREIRQPVEVSPPAQAEQWVPAPVRHILSRDGQSITLAPPRVAPPHTPPSRPGLPSTMRLLPAQRDQHAAPLPGTL